MTKLEFLLDIQKYTTSFFLGLLLNSFVDHWKEKRVARRMLNAIAAEARANLAILQESFLAYFREGLVLREFSIDAVSQYLADPLFVRHAPPHVVEALYAYFRNLKLSNAYRERAEHIRLSGEKNKWLEGLIEKWAENLELCKHATKDISKLGGDRE